MPYTARCRADRYPSMGRHRSRIVNLGLREQLCHLLSMGVPDVAVRPEDELAAVLMTLPRGDDVHIDTLLDAPGD